MSIASELTRIQNAKTDIKEAIENKGVEVPEEILIDGYAELIDEIEGGGGRLQPLQVTENGIYLPEEGYDGFSVVSANVSSGITKFYDLKYMFSHNARIADYSKIMERADKNIEDFSGFLENTTGFNLANVDLTEFPENINITNFLLNASNSGVLSLKNKNLNATSTAIGNSQTNGDIDFSNTIVDLDGSKIPAIDNLFSGGYESSSKNRTRYLHIRNFNEELKNYQYGTVFNRIVFDDDNFDISDIDFSHLLGNRVNYYIFDNIIAKNVKMPKSFAGISQQLTFYYLLLEIYRGLLSVENLTLPENLGNYTYTSQITSAQLFDGFQTDVTDKNKMIEVDMEQFFPVGFLNKLAPTTNCFGDVNQYDISTGYGGPRGFINVHLTNQTTYVRPFGTSTTNVYNDICRFNLKNGTTWASNTYNSECSLYLAYLWRGAASSIPDRDIEGKTTEDYFVEFLNSLGANTSGYNRNIRIYSGLYNTISAETKQIAIDKNYILVSTSTS